MSNFDVLLIGGPDDGKRISVADGTTFLDVFVQRSVLASMNAFNPDSTSATATSTYGISMRYLVRRLTNKVAVGHPEDYGPDGWERTVFELVRGYGGWGGQP